MYQLGISKTDLKVCELQSLLSTVDPEARIIGARFNSIGLVIILDPKASE